jgi:hypothetical protein
MPKRKSKAIFNSHKFDMICKSKTVYQSERDALEGADFRMSEHIGLQLGVYKCSVCQLWHLTEIKNGQC